MPRLFHFTGASVSLLPELESTVGSGMLEEGIVMSGRVGTVMGVVLGVMICEGSVSGSVSFLPQPANDAISNSAGTSAKNFFMVILLLGDNFRSYYVQ